MSFFYYHDTLIRIVSGCSSKVLWNIQLTLMLDGKDFLSFFFHIQTNDLLLCQRMEGWCHRFEIVHLDASWQYQTNQQIDWQFLALFCTYS